jgi:hypothetical protein
MILARTSETSENARSLSSVDSPTWTILIPTIPKRGHLLRRLLDGLLPQLDEHEGRVKVVAWLNRGEPRLAEIRDRMIREADTDYVSFVDDDDLVPEFFVKRIVEALDQRPDKVGFKLEYFRDGIPQEIVEHRLEWRRWGRSDHGQLFRDVTHLDPIRAEIARAGRFARAKPGRAEDRIWVKQIRAFLATEVFIDEVMYFYLWYPDESAWNREDGPVGGAPPGLAPIEHPYFRWHPLSVS